MPTEESARWCCANRDCNWYMVATVPQEGNVTPKCICGGEMRKTELVRVLNYLDFLRGDTEMRTETQTEWE